MDLKTRKGVRVIGIIALLMISAIGFMLVIQPLITQSSKFSDEIAVAEADLGTAQQKLIELQTQRDNIGVVEDLDSELSEMFPGMASAPELVSYIQKAASDAGLSPQSITTLTVGVPALVSAPAGVAPVPADGAAPAGASEIDGAAATDATADPAADPAAADPAAAPTPGDAAGSSNLAEVPIEVAVEGSPQQLAEFMTNLTSSKMNLEILTYSISGEAEGGDGAGGSTATISLKTYIYNSVPKVSEQQEAPVAVDPAVDPAAQAPVSP